MLGLINDVRQEHNLEPVVLGDNPAAQQHAESMLANNFVSHWGVDGLMPSMRYTLAGGENYMAENVSGHILQKGLHYQTRGSDTMLTELHRGLMQSSLHRKNILNKWHKKVNLGIACDLVSCSVAQNFEGDYIEFSDKPAIFNGVLSLAGRLKGGFVLFRGSIQVWYHQPPHPLSLSALYASSWYRVGGQEPAMSIIKPAPQGEYYSSLTNTYSWRHYRDPYAPHAPIVEKGKLGVKTVADKWQVNGAAFAIEARLSQMALDLGPGVYTVLIWGDNGGESVLLSNYSIFLSEIDE